VWILFVGVKLLGFSKRDVWLMTLDTWNRLFDWYKQFYNFRVNNNLFKIKEIEDNTSSLEWFKD
jgi:hypothetical protein